MVDSIYARDEEDETMRVAKGMKEGERKLNLPS